MVKFLLGFFLSLIFVVCGTQTSSLSSTPTLLPHIDISTLPAQFTNPVIATTPPATFFSNSTALSTGGPTQSSSAVMLTPPSAFYSQQFLNNWLRTDYPVTTQIANRSWYWGPQPLGPGLLEPYTQAPNDQRLVQYFDKGRMEIINPSSSYVTNGLLVVEMIKGQIQIGDTEFEAKDSPKIPVVGDLDNSFPTYSDLQEIYNKPLNVQLGQSITQQFDSRHTWGIQDNYTSDPLTKIVTNQNNFAIPAAFWNFMNSSGKTFEQGVITSGIVSNWLSSIGYPVTSAFWAKVTVDGIPKDVLVQAFERRILTYTPNNKVPFKVEMGNVGSAYLKWRYSGSTPLIAPVPTTPPVVPTPIATSLPVQHNNVEKIASLMFHYVRVVDRSKDPLGYGLSVTPENFTKYLDWIAQNGYHTVTVSQISDYLRYGTPLPEKPIQLRFDDGVASDWLIYQELKKRGMTATFFVISQRLQLTPEQWRQIDADGFEIGAHTRTHPDLRGVSKIQLKSEIAGSKEDLEAMLGHPIRSFAYPSGAYNQQVYQVVKDSGFEIACSTHGGWIWSLANYLVEPTIEIIGNDTLASFVTKIKSAPGASF